MIGDIVSPTRTKTLLAGALALGAALATAAPAVASDIDVRIDLGREAGRHGGVQEAQYYGGDGYGYGPRVRRGYDGPRYGFRGDDGYDRGYGRGGYGGCRIVIRERVNRFGEVVQIRRRVCG